MDGDGWRGATLCRDRSPHRRRTRVRLRQELVVRPPRQGAQHRDGAQMDRRGHEERLEASLRIREQINRSLTGRHLSASARGTRLQLSISAVFALLILPALGAVIAFSYYENARNLSTVSQRFIDRARDDALDMVSNFLDPVAAILRLVAELA